MMCALESKQFDWSSQRQLCLVTALSCNRSFQDSADEGEVFDHGDNASSTACAPSAARGV